MNSVALSFSTKANINITHEQLVNLFSNAELHNAVTFNVYVKDEHKDLKYKGPGNFYEDYLVNVLVNGGVLCVADNEDSYDYPVTLEDANKTKNSSVLNVASVEEFESLFWDDSSYFTPVYEITLDRISKAFQEILSGTTTCEDNDTEKLLMENYQNTFVNESGDYFDALNIFQYIVFGDVIYG